MRRILPPADDLFASASAAHPFGAGAGLARAAAAQDEPGAPGLAVRRNKRHLLMPMRERLPSRDGAPQASSSAGLPGTPLPSLGRQQKLQCVGQAQRRNSSMSSGTGSSSSASVLHWVGLIEGGKFAQGLHQHREHARVTFALARLLPIERKALLDVAHLPLGGAPEPRHQRDAVACKPATLPQNLVAAGDRRQPRRPAGRRRARNRACPG